MDNGQDGRGKVDRRNFLKAAGAGMTAAAAIMTPRQAALAQEAAHKAALDRIASNTYPIRPLFKSRILAGTATRQGAAGGASRPDRDAEAAALAQNPNAAGPLAVANAATAARANLPTPQQMKTPGVGSGHPLAISAMRLHQGK